MSDRDPGRGASTPWLVVFDVDSTLTRTEGIDLLAEIAGVGDEVAAITAAAMRGELDFAASLRRRVALLAGLPVEALMRAAALVEVTDGARQVCGALTQRGHVVAAVSGGFCAMVGPLGDDLGLTHTRANDLEVRDGVLTGEVTGPVIDRAAKAAALLEWAELHEIPRERTVAVGDGANDLDMLAAAGLGIAFDPKPALRAAADIVIEGPSLLPLLDLVP